MGEMVGSAAEVRQRRRAISAGFIGTLIEWYDFVIFGTTASLVFGSVFYPETSKFVGVLASLSTFAVGFIARPLGGVFFGHLGDRIGRQPTLVATMIVMGGSSLVVGLLPTYHSVGVLAPILLVLFRLIQGFSLGGEFGGVATLLMEYSRPERRGRTGSWAQQGGLLGPLLGTLIMLLTTASMSHDALLSWGWRIPFLGSVVLVGIALWIRSKVHETPAFLEAQRSGTKSHNPLKDSLKHNWRGILAVFGLMAGNTVLFYTGSTFNLSYVANRRGLPDTGSLLLTVCFLFGASIFAYLTGGISDKYGRRIVALVAAAAGAAFAFPLYALINTDQWAWMLLASFVVGCIEGSLYGFQPAYFGELFPTQRRYAGMSLGVQLATVAIGSTAPILGTVFVQITDGGTWMYSSYIIVIMAITVGAALLAGETAPSRESKRSQATGSVETGEAA